MRPSRYCSTTAGLTYDARATAGVFPSRSPTDRITAADKLRLDALHLTKIDLACWVLVVNPGGYIGDSTRREIAHARKLLEEGT